MSQRSLKATCEDDTLSKELEELMDQEAIQVGFTSDWVTQSILLLILRKLQSFLVAVIRQRHREEGSHINGTLFRPPRASAPSEDSFQEMAPTKVLEPQTSPTVGDGGVPEKPPRRLGTVLEKPPRKLAVPEKPPRRLGTVLEKPPRLGTVPEKPPSRLGTVPEKPPRRLGTVLEKPPRRLVKAPTPRRGP